MIYSKHPAKGPKAVGTTVRLPCVAAPAHVAKFAPPAPKTSHDIESRIVLDTEAASSETDSLCKRWPPLCGPLATESRGLSVCGISRTDVLEGHRICCHTTVGVVIFGFGLLIGWVGCTVL